jgi:ribosome maturation factor RimP
MSVPPIRDTELTRLRDAAGRIARSYGLEVFDLQFRREAPGWVLRVVLDRPWRPDAVAPGATEEPVGIEDCQRVSHDLSALLDVDEGLAPLVDREYTLEVSSPGLDRALRGDQDYRRFAGRLAKIVTTEPVQGQTHFEGRLAGVEGVGGAEADRFVLVAEGRRVHRVPIGLIKRARLEVEF